VEGTFKIGMSEYDQMFIFMPLKEAQLFFGIGDTAGASSSWSPSGQDRGVAQQIGLAAGPARFSLTGSR